MKVLEYSFGSTENFPLRFQMKAQVSPCKIVKYFTTSKKGAIFVAG